MITALAICHSQDSGRKGRPGREERKLWEKTDKRKGKYRRKGNISGFLVSLGLRFVSISLLRVTLMLLLNMDLIAED